MRLLIHWLPKSSEKKKSRQHNIEGSVEIRGLFLWAQAPDLMPWHRFLIPKTRNYWLKKNEKYKISLGKIQLGPVFGAIFGDSFISY